MTDAREMVKQESINFEKAIPELLKTLRGRWVVFKDGTVQCDYKTETEAYSSGLKRYGLEGGFVVAEVREVEHLPLTAGIIYGLDLSC